MSAANQPHNIIDDVGKLLSALIGVLQKLKKLFQLEWQLAEKSIPIIIVLGILFFVVLLGTWLFTSATAVLLLQHVLHNWLEALLITVAANLLLLSLLLKMLISYSKNLHFSHTRKQLSQWRGNNDVANKNIEETN
jgi:hypothetical protein